MGKQNQTDGQKGLIKSGVYIGTSACKNLSDMKTHQLGISWLPPLPSVSRCLKTGVALYILRQIYSAKY